MVTKLIDQIYQQVVWIIFVILLWKIDYKDYFCDAKCSEYDSVNGCINPLNSLCDDQVDRCTCKEKISIYMNGYCLKPIVYINGPCWISDQCVVTGSKCFTKDGKGEVLESIIDSHWNKFIQSNGSEFLVPGTCLCNIGYVFSFIEAKCIPRLIDSACITEDECQRRSQYSRCIQNRCACLTRYLYNYRNDRCIFAGEGSWNRRNCFDGTCRGGNSEQFVYHHSLANIFGFSLSMTMLMVVWIVVRNCHRTRLSERSMRLEELRYSDLRIAYDPFDVVQTTTRIDENLVRSSRARENLPMYEEIQPPTYEEAVIKIGGENSNPIK